MFILKKVISLLLCIVMLIPVLASCDTDDSHNHKTSESTTESSQGSESDHTHTDTKQPEETTDGIQPHTHTPATAVTEKFVDSSCTATGSYDEVVYCSECQAEISRTQKTVDKKPHDHNQKVTTAEYLKAEATCTDSAVYYYSCSCGDKGTASFSEGDPSEHTYNQKVVANKYLKSSADCNNAAVYYYSCVCGVKGSTTFTDGEANGHSYSSTWENNATHHWHKATCEHTTEISGKAEHNYGTDNVCDTCGYDRTINVSSVTLNFSSLALTVDDVKTLIATITPNNATNQSVTWTTSNASIVAVDTNGKITAVGVGTATITVTTADGNKTAQCTVIVSAKVCPHTTTRIERENEVDSTCKVTGTYDEVVYCSTCGDELSRTDKIIPKKTTHTGGTPVHENIVDSTCKEVGSYDEVVYCSICNHEISRTEKIIPKKTTHTNGTPVTENIVDSTCAEEGSYDEVVYCSICNHEISRTKKIIPKKTTHTNGTPVTENIVDSTCAEEGSYDEVVYCSECQAEISRTQKTVDKKPHDHNQKVTTAEYLKAEATCTEIAVYYYSCVCGEKGTNTFTSGSVIPHTFDQKNTASTYIKSPATCTEATTYYHSCICGKKGTSSFSSGSTLPHTEGDWIIDKAPTVGKIGNKHTECTECGKKIREEIIPATCLITWKNNDGTTLKTTYCETGKIPSFGDGVPTRESDSQYSYTFAGWATEIVAATENATYVAIYNKSERTSYTISYNANGGTNTPSSQSRNTGTSMKLASTIPVLDGKDFVGWSCANDGQVYVAGASFNVDADVTLYAVWGHNCSTCLGNGTISTTVTCSNCFGDGKTTSYDKYWDDCDNGCSSGSLYRWVKCYSCKSAGGLATAFCTACKGAGRIRESYTCPVCSGTGGCYQYSKKTCKSCGGSGEVSSAKACTRCNGDRAFADTYDSYTITLTDRNSTLSTSSLTVNTPYKLTVPVRSGYTFLGWFDAEANGTQYTDGEGVCLAVWSDSENKTLYARWSLNYYTITYDCDEDVDVSGMPTLYTVKDEDITLSKQNTIHKKLSWKLKNETVVSIDTSMAKDIIISGVWSFYTAGTPVEENRIEPTTCVDGHYDIVIYCSKCNEELSRKTVILPAGHKGKNGVCTVCGNKCFSSGLEFTSNGDGTCYVSGIDKCTDTSVHIPRVSPTGDSVTSIGRSAFYDCVNLVSVTIPDSVTSIGNCAFLGCDELASVTIPDSVTLIGVEVFCSCNSLTSVNVDEDNNNYKSINGNLYTKDGKTLIQYAIGKTNTSFTIPNGVTSIGRSAFYYCDNLTSVTIPNSVTSIGENAFYHCYNLTSVNIPNSVTSIGTFAFGYCIGLTSITIPNSVTSIGEVAFASCKSLKSITISNSVISSAVGTFEDCDNLTSVTIADGVTSIGEEAFYCCSNLESIIIPVSVTSIGARAFCDRTWNTTIIQFKGTKAQWNNISKGDYWKAPNGQSITIKCTDENITL